jgi:DNA-binding winged helix-turn-helix (wHTH) protein/Flp pilus assembly protein TadD
MVVRSLDDGLRVNYLLHFGEFELDTGNHVLRGRGGPLALPPKAVDALALLLAEPGQVRSRQALIDALWPDRVVEEQGLNQLVYLLRKALGKRSDGAEWIVTVPKRGYRFNGEVLRRARVPMARPADGVTRSVAVLPLQELVGVAPGLGVAIADALVTSLARRQELLVRPMASVGAEPGDTSDPRERMTALGVDLTVEGSLQWVGELLRVHLRLWTAGRESPAWSGHFEGPMDALFDIENAAAAALTAEICPRVGAQPDHSPAPARRFSAPRVREHVLRSRFLWERWTPPTWHDAIVEARAALALEAGSAEARYWWGASLVALAITGQTAAPEAFRQARALFHEAGRLDPGLDLAWEGLGAVALFHDWDPPTAIDCLRRAIELQPGNARARDLYALALAASGDVDSALVEIGGAYEIDPLSLLVGTDVGYMQVFARRYEAAEAAFRRVLALEPHFAHARLYLGTTLAWQGRGAEATIEIRCGLADCGRDPASSHELAHAQVVAGHVGEAEAILRALEEKLAGSFADPFELAATCIALGRLDQAMAWLERALVSRSRQLGYIRVEPMFDPLRDRSDFQNLLTRVHAGAWPADRMAESWSAGRQRCP